MIACIGKQTYRLRYLLRRVAYHYIHGSLSSQDLWTREISISVHRIHRLVAGSGMSLLTPVYGWRPLVVRFN